MNANTSRHISTRHDWIDVLRAIAILMVIAVHTSHGLKDTSSLIKWIFGFGGFGVQLFFIASAMTLCMSMQRNYHSKSNIYYYCLRRFFRISPLYYFGIVIYFIWSIAKNYVLMGNFSPLPQYTLQNILANILFVNGFVPEANNNIVPGGWSIGTEVSFYVLFPFIFNLFNKCKKPSALFLLTAILLIIELALLTLTENIIGSSINNSEFIYFNITSQLQVFIIGILGFYFINTLRKINNTHLAIVSFFFFIIGSELWNLPFEKSKFFALTSLSISFVIFSGIVSKFNSAPQIIKNIGQRSFSMYITHFIFMNMIDYGFNNAINLFGNLPNIKALVHFITALLVTYFISGYTKKYIEDPFIRLGNSIILKTKNVETQIVYDRKN